MGARPAPLPHCRSAECGPASASTVSATRHLPRGHTSCHVLVVPCRHGTPCRSRPHRRGPPRRHSQPADRKRARRGDRRRVDRGLRGAGVPAWPAARRDLLGGGLAMDRGAAGGVVDTPTSRNRYPLGSIRGETRQSGEAGVAASGLLNRSWPVNRNGDDGRRESSSCSRQRMRSDAIVAITTVGRL